ncbi:MAG: hypothetical protein QE279_03580 [Rhodoferax sp.]|nr:hypothetical protein [Rhodoferax sp.]
MKKNQERADAAELAIALYKTQNDNEDALCDLLCDLEHLCAQDPSYGSFQDVLRLAKVHFLTETSDDLLPFGGPAEIPTVVIDIDGGAIHGVRANMPMRVLILDADTEGSDGERIQSIEGVEVYVHDHHLLPGSENISPEGVQAVLMELGDNTDRLPNQEPTAIINELIAGLPGQEGYEIGYRDALESVASALDGSVPKSVLRLVITAAMDAYANNSEKRGMGLQSDRTPVQCHFEAYAAHEHGDSPVFASLRTGVDFLVRLRTAARWCDKFGLLRVAMDAAPDQWGPGEVASELRLVDTELVVSGGLFWFQANVKHGNYHVETRAQDIEDFCRAVESSNQEHLFFGENDDLEAEVLDALGVAD